MLILALLLPAQDADPAPHQTPAEVMEMHRQRWRGDVQCEKARDENEIVVCSRRDADKYRVPLVSSYHGKESADARIGRLFDGADGRPPCGEGAFLVRCGSVGVTVSVSARGVRQVRRELAP